MKRKKLTEREAVRLACLALSSDEMYDEARLCFAEPDEFLPNSSWWVDVQMVAVQLCMEKAGL